MKKEQKGFFQLNSLGKIAGLILGMGLFLFCFNVISVKADSPYLIKHGPVFQGTLAASNYARVIKVGSTYHLWYENTATKKLYHTTSSDGETWALETVCKVGLLETMNVHEPSVIWDSTEAHFKMWYESLEAGHSGEIWYTESADGITWDAPQQVTFNLATSWEDNGRYMPFVMKDELTYKMWYQSFSAADPGDKRINYATSSDGKTFDNSGEFHQVTFSGNTNNNIVYSIGGAGDWDEGGIYSQALINVTAQLDGEDPMEFYLMLYGGLSAIPGDFYKIGVTGSPDGIEWFGSDMGPILSSEGAGNIWFPSIVLNMDDNNLDNAVLQLWYMQEGTVQYATLGNVFQDIGNEVDSAKSLSWKAYQYDNPNKSCTSRLKLIIKGKQFDKDAEVRIGGKEASSVDVQSSKRIVAKFCLTHLLEAKTDHKRTITVRNPDTDPVEAKKKIDLDNVMPKISADIFDMQTTEGIQNIQRALVKLGLLDEQYVTGIYGPITTEAVRKFQEQNGLPTTGYFGPLTKAKLEKKLK